MDKFPWQLREPDLRDLPTALHWMPIPSQHLSSSECKKSQTGGWATTVLPSLNVRSDLCSNRGSHRAPRNLGEAMVQFRGAPTQRMLSSNTTAHRRRGSTDLKGAGQEEKRCGTVDSGHWPAKGRQELPDHTLPHPAQPSPGFGRKSHGGTAVGQGPPAAGPKPEIQTTVQLWDWVAPALTESQSHQVGACHLVVAALKNPQRHWTRTRGRGRDMPQTSGLSPKIVAMPWPQGQTHSSPAGQAHMPAQPLKVLLPGSVLAPTYGPQVELADRALGEWSLN